MPRNTRAAKRAEEFEIAQDQEQIASTPQDTQAETTAATENAPSSNRAALKEVTANVIQEFVEQQNIDVKDQQDAEHNKGKNKGSTKGKGGKSGGSKGKKNQNKQHGNDREDNPNNTQPAPELQRQDTATSSESSGAAAAEQLKYATISDQNLGPINNTASSTSPAADRGLELVQDEASTLPLEHSEKENEEPMLTGDNHQGSSEPPKENGTDQVPIEPVEEPTADQTTTSPEVDESVAVKKLEDLFLSGSPAKENGIEGKGLDEVLSTTPRSGSDNEAPKQPAKTNNTPSARKKPTPTTAGRAAPATSSVNKLAHRPSAAPNKRLDQLEKKTPATLRGRPSQMNSTLKTGGGNAKPTGTAETPKSDSKAAGDDKEQAKKGTLSKRPTIAALKEPPKPIRSSKPVTTSTFQLPGEAVAAKHKAQREERQKKQEAEEAQKANFKARPVPKRRPVEVKGTNTSRARMSVGPNDPKTEPERANTVRVAKRESLVSNVGSATIGRAPRLSTATTRGKPSDDAKTQSRTGPQSRTLNSRPSILNTASDKTGDTSVSDSQAPQRVPGSAFSTSASGSSTIKGKEIFKRDKIRREEEERIAREKGEAAKKARAEAALRGRQASREWAEKLKKQKAAKMGKPVAPVADQDIAGPGAGADETVVEAGADGVVEAPPAPTVQIDVAE